MYKGVPASPGIVIAEAKVITPRVRHTQDKGGASVDTNKETKRLEAAVEKTKMEILKIKEKVVYDIGNSEAEIFNAYLLLLDDAMFIGKAKEFIRNKKVKAEYAMSMVLKDYTEFFDNISDSYLKEKSRDISGLVDKVLNNLAEISAKEQIKLREKYIVVARDLSPTDTAEMDKNKVLGFATETGGATSHTAIVARSLEIPAVVGVRDITSCVDTGDILVLDGEKGVVAVNPSQKILRAYQEERKKYVKKQKALKKLKRLETMTKDRHKIFLGANIEFPEEVGAAISNSAEEIGLFRSEFIYINKMNLPSEKEQFSAYKSVVEKMSPKSVTIRTLDVGGDKFLPYFKISPEKNPYLGLRAIRLSLSELNIFKDQLRAILRASAFGKVKILFPMISVFEEITAAKKILDEVKKDLKGKRIPFDEGVKTGAMIEVPSAAIISEHIAGKVDFLSIGTNDLIQYTLAVDRGNESVSKYYDAFNPAVLKLIQTTIDNAHNNNIPVSVCGEMAGAPPLAVLLTGMGIDGLSVSPASVLSVKKVIRSINFKDAINLAKKTAGMKKSSDIKGFIMTRLNQLIYNNRNGEK